MLTCIWSKTYRILMARAIDLVKPLSWMLPDDGKLLFYNNEDNSHGDANIRSPRRDMHKRAGEDDRLNRHNCSLELTFAAFLLWFLIACVIYVVVFFADWICCLSEYFIIVTFCLMGTKVKLGQ